MMTWAKVKLIAASVVAIVVATTGTGGLVLSQALGQASPTTGTTAAPTTAPASQPIYDPMAPTLVTLQATDVDAWTMIQELARKSGVSVDFWPEYDLKRVPRITVDIKDRPFWLAMREICDQAELQADQWGDEGGIRVSRSGQAHNNLFTCMGGSFLIIPTGISRSYSSSLEGADPAQVVLNFGISFRTWVDPKVFVLQIDHRPQLTEAVDDRGNSLIADRSSATSLSSAASFGRAWRLDIHSNLSYPPSPGEKIVRLKGTFAAVVATKFQTTEITDLMKARNVTRDLGPLQLTGVQFRSSGDRSYSYALSVQKVESKSLNRWMGKSQSQENPEAFFEVLDTEGRTVTSGRVRSGGLSGSMGSVNEPAKLILKVPVETKTIQVPFEFTGLPLP